MKLTPELLARGQERFDAMCAECHDRTGSGNGMVVQRGFPQPPSYHVDRLRNAPIGHFFDVITNGYGVMYSYATRVDPATAGRLPPTSALCSLAITPICPTSARPNGRNWRAQ